MYLLIDTSKFGELSLRLKGDSIDETITSNGRAKDISTEIDRFLNSQNIKPKDLSGIAVVMAEGSFTGTRLACVVANIFHFVYGTEIIGVSSEDRDDFNKIFGDKTNSLDRYISPRYSAPPNIR